MYWLDTCPGKLLEELKHNWGLGEAEFRVSSLWGLQPPAEDGGEGREAGSIKVGPTPAPASVGGPTSCQVILPVKPVSACCCLVWRPTSWPGPVRPVISSPHGPPAFYRPVFDILCPQVTGCHQVSDLELGPQALFFSGGQTAPVCPGLEVGRVLLGCPLNSFETRTILVKLGEVVTLLPEAWTPHTVPVVTSAHIEPVPGCSLRRSPGYTPPGHMRPPACPLWLLHFSFEALITTASNITSCGISFLICKACTSLTGGSCLSGLKL